MNDNLLRYVIVVPFLGQSAISGTLLSVILKTQTFDGHFTHCYVRNYSSMQKAQENTAIERKKHSARAHGAIVFQEFFYVNQLDKPCCRWKQFFEVRL